MNALIARFMRWLALLLLCIASTLAPAIGRERDSWRTHDKIDHFTTSAGLAFVARGVITKDPLIAVGLALIPGAVNELVNRPWSSKDMRANLLGALAGAYLAGFVIQAHERHITVAYRKEF